MAKAYSILHGGGASVEVIIEGLNSLVKGGLIGGSIQQLPSGSGGTLFGPPSTTSRFPLTSDVLLAPIAFCISSTQLTHVLAEYWYQTKAIGGTALTQDSKASVVLPGSPIGAYKSVFGLFAVARGTYLEITGNSIASGADASAWCAEIRGAAVQPLGVFCSAGGLVGLSETDYTSIGQGSNLALDDMGDEDHVVIPMPAGTLRRLQWVTTATQTGTGSLVATVRDNKVNTSVTITIAAGGVAGIRINDANTHHFDNDDLLSIALVNNGTAAAAATNTLSWEYIFDDETITGLIPFPKADRALTASATRFWPAFANEALGTTEPVVIVPIVRPATVGELRVYVDTAPANDLVLAVMKNGVATSITVTITSGTAAQSVVKDVINTVHVDAGDYISLRSISGASTQASISGASLVERADE